MDKIINTEMYHIFLIKRFTIKKIEPYKSNVILVKISVGFFI